MSMRRPLLLSIFSTSSRTYPSVSTVVVSFRAAGLCLYLYPPDRLLG